MFSQGDKLEQQAKACKVVIPEDGFLWKKYGQKFIKSIRRNRSYFKCQNTDCPVKKRVEWSAMDASRRLKITYEGVHNHPPLEPTSSPFKATDFMANEYNLLSQVLRTRKSAFLELPEQQPP